MANITSGLSYPWLGLRPTNGQWLECQKQQAILYVASLLSPWLAVVSFPNPCNQDNHVPLHGTLLRVPVPRTSLSHCCYNPSADTMELVKTESGFRLTCVGLLVKPEL